MRERLLTIASLVFALATPLVAQHVETGFLDRSITVGGRSYHYQVYVPADYASKSNWPAILFLHGAGERGNDGLLQTAVGLGAAIRQNPSRYPAIVVFPQAPPDSQWVGTPADMAVGALQQTMREFHVDASRVYLTGLSMGGHGTWYVAYRHPELFAAVVYARVVFALFHGGFTWYGYLGLWSLLDFSFSLFRLAVGSVTELMADHFAAHRLNLAEDLSRGLVRAQCFNGVTEFTQITHFYPTVKLRLRLLY